MHPNPVRPGHAAASLLDCPGGDRAAGGFRLERNRLDLPRSSRMQHAFASSAAAEWCSRMTTRAATPGTPGNPTPLALDLLPTLPGAAAGEIGGVSADCMRRAVAAAGGRDERQSGLRSGSDSPGQDADWSAANLPPSLVHRSGGRCRSAPPHLDAALRLIGVAAPAAPVAAPVRTWGGWRPAFDGEEPHW